MTIRIDTTRSLTVSSIIRSKQVYGLDDYSGLTEFEITDAVELIFNGAPFPRLTGIEDQDGVTILQDGGILKMLEDFIDGKLNVNLYGYYKDIAPLLQARIEDTKIRTVIIQPPTTTLERVSIERQLKTVYNILIR